MGMRGIKGRALLCEKCGHEEVIFSPEKGFNLFQNIGKKVECCPVCGGRMKRHPTKVVRF